MKTRNTLMIGVATALMVGAVIYACRKRKENQEQVLTAISDEGYETAHDILFPLRPKRKFLKQSYY